ncbi:protein phosphatase [Promicromonospora sp. AC04]|uniref:PP2C family protein-serine/threonine phosphatase n=1 Tax=Promicromonospora sp. AC04 TaxID=2135723 RepID=UPI000D3BC50C|nr:protein phosphatase 2C domain-containing protein [Promicromonospora sp. AC04]PUB30144.1 protein phosphatase [Promicromonospora sp. AC04]
MSEQEQGLTTIWGAASHQGRRRSLNEDGYLATGRVFFVADGMGGHEAGEVASAEALSALSGLADVDRVEPALVEAFLEIAQQRIRAIETDSGNAPGTTLTGVLVDEREDVPYWLFVNVGDSRTYMMTNGVLAQVSVDHSEVQELVDAGTITMDEARRHPRRNVITRALGAQDGVRADFRYIPVALHDRVLICSDGLTGELTDEQITTILLEQPDPERAAGILVDAAIQAGGRDNITVIIVDVTGVDHETLGSATAPRPGEEPDEDTRPREEHDARSQGV